MNYKEASLASRSQDGLLLWKLRGKDPPPQKNPYLLDTESDRNFPGVSKEPATSLTAYSVSIQN